MEGLLGPEAAQGTESAFTLAKPFSARPPTPHCSITVPLCARPSPVRGSVELGICTWSGINPRMGAPSHSRAVGTSGPAQHWLNDVRCFFPSS